jgi:hypothetical protein
MGKIMETLSNSAYRLSSLAGVAVFELTILEEFKVLQCIVTWKIQDLGTY